MAFLLDYVSRAANPQLSSRRVSTNMNETDMKLGNTRLAPNTDAWLKRYYFTRFVVSALWAIVAVAIAKNNFDLAAIMLVTYPLWDALANYLDAQRSGGLIANKSQMINFTISIITALAVTIALTQSMNTVLFVFGTWAVVAGLLQVATGVRRWKSANAQWAMILSGAQSALAGGFFIYRAGIATNIGIGDVAGYAAFGAFYFLVSVVWLVITNLRRSSVRSPA
jgi:uncharacterized membrane protein HdeD (DUF308 family)